MESSHDLINSSQLFEAQRQLVKISQHVRVLLLTSKNCSAPHIGVHLNTCAQTRPDRHIDLLAVRLAKNCQKISERLQIFFDLIIVPVHFPIKQITDLLDFITPEFHKHLGRDVRDRVKRSVFIGTELFTVVSHRRHCPATDEHGALFDLVVGDVGTFNPELVRPHLKFEKIIVTLLLSFIDKTRLHDSECSGTKRQYTREKRLEVIEDIAPAIASVLPVHSSRFAKEYGWQDRYAKNDANQNPEFCYVITRHRPSPKLFTSPFVEVLGADSTRNQHYILESVCQGHSSHARKQSLQQTNNVRPNRDRFIPEFCALLPEHAHCSLDLLPTANITKPTPYIGFSTSHRSEGGEVVHSIFQGFDFQFQASIKKFMSLFHTRLLEYVSNSSRDSLHFQSNLRFLFVDTVVNIQDGSALQLSEDLHTIGKLSVIGNQKAFDDKCIPPRLKFNQFNMPLLAPRVSDLHLSNGEERCKASQDASYQSLVVIQKVPVREGLVSPISACQSTDTSHDNDSIKPPVSLGFQRVHPMFPLPAGILIRFLVSLDVTSCLKACLPTYFSFLSDIADHMAKGMSK